MAHFVTTVRTEQSVEEVFAFVSDLENFTKWDPGVESSTQSKGEGPGLGATYEVKASGAVLTYKIVEFDEPNRMVAEAKTRFLRSYDVITVEERQASTYISYDATLDLNGPLAIGDGALGMLFKKIGDKAAEGLVKALDGIRIE